MGIIGTLLNACGVGGGEDRSDVKAVQEALQDAVELQSEHLDGAVRFQDSSQEGTVISGVFTVAGEDRAKVTACFAEVLDTVVRTYREQEGVRTACVRLAAHPAGDRATRVTTADVVAPADGEDVTTDDLAAHFGLSPAGD